MVEREWPPKNLRGWGLYEEEKVSENEDQTNSSDVNKENKEKRVKMNKYTRKIMCKRSA